MGLCQMPTKGRSVYRGEVKNSSSCVGVEYSSQATTANPHFFRFPPPLCWFLGLGVYLFNFVATSLPSGIKKCLTLLLNYVITPSENYEKSTEIYNNATAKNWKNSAKNWNIITQWKSWKPALDGVRGTALPSPKKRKNAILLFNFSTPCQADHSAKCE